MKLGVAGGEAEELAQLSARPPLIQALGVVGSFAKLTQLANLKRKKCSLCWFGCLNSACAGSDRLKAGARHGGRGLDWSLNKKGREWLGLLKP